MLHLLPDRSARPARFASGTRLLTRIGVTLFMVSWFAATLAFAKDVPITGVLVYRQSGAFNYAQISGFLVNGKTEMRACPGGKGIDKSTYKALAIAGNSSELSRTTRGLSQGHAS